MRTLSSVASAFLLASVAGAQMPTALPAAAGSAKSVSVAQYRDHLVQLRDLVRACGKDSAACKAGQVGSDDRITPADGGRPPFQARYGWLREMIGEIHDNKREHRADDLAAADRRLQEQIAELETVSEPVKMTKAQLGRRDAILNRAEFREVGGFSVSDTLVARVQRWLGRFFSGVGTFGEAFPWLGTALEWGTLALTALLILFWIYRSLERQRVALGRLHSNGFTSSAAAEESRNWASQARSFAEALAWRDAVHCLYWASIVALEDRRLFRPNRTRTPRECLRLLSPGSDLRPALERQTRDFERIWYGLRDADEMDYKRALASYEILRPGTTLGKAAAG